MIDIFKTKYSDWNSLERTIEAIGVNNVKGGVKPGHGAE